MKWLDVMIHRHVDGYYQEFLKKQQEHVERMNKCTEQYQARQNEINVGFQAHQKGFNMRVLESLLPVDKPKELSEEAKALHRIAESLEVLVKWKLG